MSVTQVSICNSALIKVGADRISSINEDTRSAILLKALWDQALDATLRDHPWNRAIMRAALAPVATAPAFGWDYAYDLPSDMIRVLEVMDEDEVAADYAIEGDKICSDAASLLVRYVYRVTDPSNWDAMFAETLAWRLARDVSFALSGSMENFKVCDDQYRKAIKAARTADGMEGTMPVLIADDWTGARL